MAGNRQWDGQKVVTDGQNEILPHHTPRGPRHGQCAGQRQQGCAEEHEIGGLAPDIAGAARRDRGVGGGEGRPVVEAVAGHHHLVALCLQGGDGLLFAGRGGGGDGG